MITTYEIKMIIPVLIIRKGHNNDNMYNTDDNTDDKKNEQDE